MPLDTDQILLNYNSPKDAVLAQVNVANWTYLANVGVTVSHTTVKVNIPLVSLDTLQVEKFIPPVHRAVNDSFSPWDQAPMKSTILLITRASLLLGSISQCPKSVITRGPWYGIPYLRH